LNLVAFFPRLNLKAKFAEATLKLDLRHYCHLHSVGLSQAIRTALLRS